MNKYLITNPELSDAIDSIAKLEQEWNNICLLHELGYIDDKEFQCKDKEYTLMFETATEKANRLADEEEKNYLMNADAPYCGKHESSREYD